MNLCSRFLNDWSVVAKPRSFSCACQMAVHLDSMAKAADGVEESSVDATAERETAMCGGAPERRSAGLVEA